MHTIVPASDSVRLVQISYNLFT